MRDYTSPKVPSLSRDQAADHTEERNGATAAEESAVLAAGICTIGEYRALDLVAIAPGKAAHDLEVDRPNRRNHALDGLCNFEGVLRTGG
jgi:hypothetical protein